MQTIGLYTTWPTLLLVVALQCAAGVVTADTTDDVTGAASPDDVLHVLLHNATHGEVRHKGDQHPLDVSLLTHNSSHSLLHMNSSTAGVHRDVLVSNGVLEALDLDADPVNRTHTPHDGWSQHEELVATDVGWMSSQAVNTSVEDRRQAMAAADRQHQSTVRVFIAVMGATVGVVFVAIVGIAFIRRRRSGDEALLNQEDEEFTVFSVVDHPYPGKKGGDYSPLR